MPRVSGLVHLLELSRAFRGNKVHNRKYFLLSIVAIIALLLQGCLGERFSPPTFNSEVTVLINPIYDEFTSTSNHYEATGDEKEQILKWYSHIKIIEEVENPSVPTEPPVPTIFLFTGELVTDLENPDIEDLIGEFAILTDIAGEYFYLSAMVEGKGVIYSCQQENIKAMFNQMRGEYKPNTTP